MFNATGLNEYGYAGNSPATIWDPSGLGPWAIVERIAGEGVRVIQEISESDVLEQLISGYEQGFDVDVATDTPEGAAQMAMDYSSQVGCGGVSKVESHVVDPQTGARGVEHIHGLETAYPNGQEVRLPGHIFIDSSLFEDLGDLLLPGPVFVGPFPALPGVAGGGGA
jgi:hypothetical protein